MIGKKTLLLSSGIFTVVLYFLNYIGTYWICDHVLFVGHEGNCPSIIANGIVNFFPIVPVFFLSFITYKMREEIYWVWLRFSYVWIPISMILIFLAPEYSNDWMYPVTKGAVASFSSLLFVIISLIIIVWKYFSTRQSK